MGKKEGRRKEDALMLLPVEERSKNSKSLSPRRAGQGAGAGPPVDNIAVSALLRRLLLLFRPVEGRHQRGQGGGDGLERVWEKRRRRRGADIFFRFFRATSSRRFREKQKNKKKSSSSLSSFRRLIAPSHCLTFPAER